MTEHLVPIKGDRGFTHLPSIVGRDMTEVFVYESSLAFEGPHLRMKIREPADLNAAAMAEATGVEYAGEWNDASIHFSSHDALKLADQLRYAVEHHYQGPPN